MELFNSTVQYFLLEWPVVVRVFQCYFQGTSSRFLCLFHWFLYICYIFQTYVQDLLRKHSAEVFELIDKLKGHFYVCGDVQMAAEVGETLEGIIANEGQMSDNKAKAYMSNLRVSLKCILYVNKIVSSHRV